MKRTRLIVLGVVVIAACSAGALWAINKLSPRNPLAEGRPELKAHAPLQPVTRTSQVVAPVAVANLAIRDIMEANAPRALNGTRDNPLADLLGKAEIGWNAARGPIQVVGVPPGINISTMVNGSLRLTGQVANQGGNITGQIGSLLGGNLGREAQKLTTRMLDQRADIRANVVINSKPALLPNWRIEPNLSGQVSMADGGMQVGGLKLNVVNEVKPMLDNAVNEQIGSLSNHLRNDRTFELAVRREWVKLCRSIALGQAAPGAPALWLEVRPTKAFAAQPRIVPDWVILTLGVQAETRIVPTETKPDCPFPAQLDLVPPIEQGTVAIAVPIDVPFTELNRLMEEQLKGKTFPDDGRSPGEVTVLAASMAAAGDRLLVSLRVKARETKSWFGFGAEATVHIWGKPDARPRQPDHAAHRRYARRRVGSGLRPARRRLPRRDPLSAGRAGQERRGGFEAVRRQCAKEHRGGAKGVQQAGRRRRGRVRHHRSAPHRRRIRLQDLARHRRGPGHRPRPGAQARAAIARFEPNSVRSCGSGSTGRLPTEKIAPYPMEDPARQVAWRRP